MNTNEKANKLLKHIQSLEGFEILVPSYPYHHMGATITDAMLQPGINWLNVVKPRIDKIKRYTAAKSTTGFLKLLEHQSPCKLLDWFDEEKPNRVLGITRFLKGETVETENDLNTWLAADTNIVKLMNQRGIGNKTFDYIKMLVGLPSVAIDRHLNNMLEQANVSHTGYAEAREIIGRVAELMTIEKHVLDHSIWKYMSSRKTYLPPNRRPCNGV